MEAPVIAAFITSGFAILLTLVSAYVTIWSSHRQRAVDLVAVALSHMGGGSQARSAGVAALMALRGPLNRTPGRFRNPGWAIYGPAVGQQLFRQLMYVLNHGSRKFHTHEVENVIAMADWLLRDNKTLKFDDAEHAEQRYRLALSIREYVAKTQPHMAKSGTAKKPEDRITVGQRASIEKLVSRSNEWMAILTG